MMTVDSCEEYLGPANGYWRLVDKSLDVSSCITASRVSVKFQLLIPLTKCEAAQIEWKIIFLQV